MVFIRFLSLLSVFDWQLEPLIVNFNNELSGQWVDGWVWGVMSSSINEMLIVGKIDIGLIISYFQCAVCLPIITSWYSGYIL